MPSFPGRREGWGLDAYRALYRTWRPRRFSEMVGQEHVTRTLRNALAAGRLHHAYLFCGPRGTGKTTVARILAQAANCLHPKRGEPCGACANCEAIAADRFLDLQEIDGASNRGIDEVRGLREDARYAAIAGRAKVYIIDEVHMLTEQAWNALLKTLEEPPPGTIFILATTDPRKIPLTALSRCQRFDFRRFTDAEIATRLREICTAEGIDIAPEALAAVARRAEGGMRDALSLLDQGIAYAGAALSVDDVAAIAGAADEAGILRTLAAVAAGDAAAAMAEVERFYVDGRDFGQVARDLAGTLRDRLVAMLTRRAADDDPLAGWSDRAQLLAAIDALAAAEGDMRRSGQPRFVLEVALLRLVAGAGAGTADAAAAAAAAAVPAVAPARRTVAPRAAVPAAAPVPTRSATGGAPPSPAPAFSPAPAPDAGAPAAGRPPRAQAPAPAPAERPAASAAAPLEDVRSAGAQQAAALEPARRAGAGDDQMGDVTARWGEVLGRLKPATQHMLRFARPIAASKRRLVLRVAGPHEYDFLKRRIGEIGQAVAGVMGGSWGVDLVTDEPAGESDLAELATQMFDGELIQPGAKPRKKDDDVPF